VKSYVPRSESLWSASAFRRILMGSCATHGALVAVLVIAPRSFLSSPPPPLPIMIEVVTSTPKPAAALPAAPAPKKQRQVVEEAVVIPDQPRAKPSPKRPKPPEPPPEPPKKEPKKPPPSAADLMAALRENAETVDSAVEESAQTEEATSGSMDAELAAYYRKVKGCLYANWVGAQQFQRRRELRVRFRVRVGMGGAVESVELVQGSGIRQLDETAERAIYKCSPLDQPPGDTSIIPLTFIPGEL